jgi:hypothetical protein
VNQTLPQISGTTRAGQPLSATAGGWTGSPAPSFIYTWQRCDADGAACYDAATGPTYVLGATDVDARLRVSITATSTAGSASAMSGLTGVVGLASDPTVVAVGDIACPAGDTTDPCQQQQTATLAASQHPDDVLMLGDAQYNAGLYSEFESAGAYNATWGVFDPIVRPVPGNHEYASSPTAAGYFQYFASAAHPTAGYYSFNLGTWHVVALNSNCSDSGCADLIPGVTSFAQTSWLQADLAANRSACVIAYWHHPRFSSGFVGDSPGVGPLWTALYEAHADLVLNGHDHLYERYAPQGSAATATGDGIREFVVGTGGESLMGITDPEPNLQVSDTHDFGVLLLTLHPSSYDWAFESVNGSVIDHGTAACHGPGAGTAGDLVARDRGSAPRLSEPQLVFDVHPLRSSIRAATRRGLPVAIHCSSACDVTVTVSARHGRHSQRIAAFYETESQIARPYSRILLRLPAAHLRGTSRITLVLRFSALDAASHRRVATSVVRLG